MQVFDSFWNFSLATYRRPGVPEAVLGLQDRLGADVNILLLCCWAGRRGVPIDLDACIRDGADWQRGVVRPLRGVRRRLAETALGPNPEHRALRRRVAALELEAERLEQTMLARALESRPGADRSARAEPSERPAEGPRAVAGAFARYLHLLGREADTDVRDDLATLLAAAFPAHDANALDAALAGGFASRGKDGSDGGKAPNVVADS